MYQPLASYFKKEAPLAEVYPVQDPKPETDYYFQLLADYGLRLNEPQNRL